MDFTKERPIIGDWRKKEKIGFQRIFKFYVTSVEMNGKCLIVEFFTYDSPPYFNTFFTWSLYQWILFLLFTCLVLICKMNSQIFTIVKNDQSLLLITNSGGDNKSQQDLLYWVHITVFFLNTDNFSLSTLKVFYSNMDFFGSFG